MPSEPVGGIRHPLCAAEAQDQSAPLFCLQRGGMELLAWQSGVYPLCTPCTYGPLTLTLATFQRAFNPAFGGLSLWIIPDPVSSSRCRPPGQVTAPGLVAAIRGTLWSRNSAVGIPLALGYLAGRVRRAFSPPMRWFLVLTNE